MLSGSESLPTLRGAVVYRQLGTELQKSRESLRTADRELARTRAANDRLRRELERLAFELRDDDRPNCQMHLRHFAFSLTRTGLCDSSGGRVALSDDELTARGGPRTPSGARPWAR